MLIVTHSSQINITVLRSCSQLLKSLSEPYRYTASRNRKNEFVDSPNEHELLYGTDGHVKLIFWGSYPRNPFSQPVPYTIRIQYPDK